jgi:protein ImuB
MTRILCLWFPNWPIQRRAGDRPELNKRAFVLEQSDARGGRVAACCARAVEQGIYPGMPVAEAKSLAPGVVVEPHDRAADRKALERLAEACEQFSPSVGLEEGGESATADPPVCGPDSLLLDVSNPENLWGSEAELAARVEKFFTRRGYRMRLAVADTVGQAWAAAHYEPDKETSRGGDEEKSGRSISPCLLVSLSPCRFSLPVEALRLSADTADLLRQLGIETIGQLLPLPRESLAARFGDGLLRRLDQFTGTASEVVAPHRALAPLLAGCAFEQPTTDLTVLTHALAGLSEQLARALAARDEGAVLLVCLLKYAQGETAPLRIGLMEPTACAQQWMELLDLHLETLKLADEVTGAELRVTVAGRLGQRQGELFADEWPTDPHQLALLVNRLSSRLGDEQVLRPELRASPMPERAARYVPAMEGRDKETRRQGNKGRSRRKHSPCPITARPLLVYPEPHTVDVVSVAPSGPPEFIWHESRREHVAQHWGPERIETLWWRGRSVRRDYYRIATESGSHLWIFRRLRDGRWFLHGMFA